MNTTVFLSSRSLFTLLLFMISGLLAACGDDQPKPSVVKMTKQNNQYGLTVNGQPYQVQGVGLEGGKAKDRALALKKAGGNTFRTWGMKNIEQELIMAQELDLMIAVGIRTGKELQGFDYNDENAVAKQYKQVTTAIDKYKHHPNVLMWVIANEPNLLFDENEQLKDVNPKVYDAMADIIDYIHKTDPNHPVTFTLAGANPKHIQQVIKHAPNIDIISVQVYGDLAVLADNITQANVDKPFMVTEFGPMGHWELPSTEWGREIEEPSAIKAAGMAKRMTENIINDKTGKIIGSFAFFWGQKQERTPTWYGMFNESGEQTARIDELTKIWTGRYPANRTPLPTAITLNGQSAVDNVRLTQGNTAQVKVMLSDPDGDTLTHQWVLMQEVETRSQGGHHEEKPSSIELQIVNTVSYADSVTMTFTIPDAPGEYRLFSYSYDGHDNVGNANFPFMVE